MGALALSILVAVLGVSDDRISKDGRADLRRPVIFDGKSIDEWIELLRKGNSDERQRAAYALGRRSMANKAAIEELCRALRDKDVFVAQAADIALGRLGPYAVEALPALIKALKDGDEFTRQNVSSTIAEIGPAAASAAPALLAALRDDRDFVRGNAAVALRTIGLRTPAITEALTKALVDKSDFVRCNAAWALWKLTGRKSGLPVLEATIKNGSGPGRWTAISALTAMGAEAKQVAPTLRGVLQARMEAPDVAMALWKTSRDPFAISALGKMLDDSKIGPHAADHLAEMGPEAKAAAPALRRAMRGNDESVAARAARALWLVDKQEAALSRLYDLLEQGDSKTRSDCCMYLTETGRSPRTVSALRKALRDPDEEVRRWARSGLKQLGVDWNELP